jgi:hypothetical protein
MIVHLELLYDCNFAIISVDFTNLPSDTKMKDTDDPTNYKHRWYNNKEIKL